MASTAIDSTSAFEGGNGAATDAAAVGIEPSCYRMCMTTWQPHTSLFSVQLSSFSLPSLAHSSVRTKRWLQWSSLSIVETTVLGLHPARLNLPRLGSNEV